MGRPWTVEDDAYLRQRYDKVPTQEIADALSRTPNAVYQRASAMKLPSYQQQGRITARHDYFRRIDSPMKAYLLGLLLADGSVSPANQIKLEIHEKDLSLAELARQEIAPGARIGFYSTETSDMCRFMIQSPELARDLAAHGVVHRKTLITQWPANLPQSLENSFVCGCYDGDGSLDKRPGHSLRWSLISGTFSFLEEVQEHVSARMGLWVGGPYRDKRHANAWSIVATGEPVRSLDGWIHREVPGLARKRLVP